MNSMDVLNRANARAQTGPSRIYLAGPLGGLNTSWHGSPNGFSPGVDGLSRRPAREACGWSHRPFTSPCALRVGSQVSHPDGSPAPHATTSGEKPEWPGLVVVGIFRKSTEFASVPGAIPGLANGGVMQAKHGEKVGELVAIRVTLRTLEGQEYGVPADPSHFTPDLSRTRINAVPSKAEVVASGLDRLCVAAIATPRDAGCLESGRSASSTSKKGDGW